MHIHFFLHSYQLPDKEFGEWVPDKEPHRYLDGVGHNVLELAKRLEFRGHLVSLGPEIMQNPNLVIFFKEQLVYGIRAQIKALSLARKLPIILIRSDLPIKFRPCIRPDIEVMANRSSARESNQVFLPPLPQRGLIPSGRAISSPIRKIVIKCNPDNLPEDLGKLRSEIATNFPNIVLRIDSHFKGGENSNRWHDFRDIDITLVLRRLGNRQASFSNKPPGRLINAWCAETIPIVYPTISYSELIRQGIDGFMVTNIKEILEAIGKLVMDENLRKSMRKSIQQRKLEFQANTILADWEKLMIHLCENTELGNQRNIRNIARLMSQALPLIGRTSYRRLSTQSRNI